MYKFITKISIAIVFTALTFAGISPIFAANNEQGLSVSPVIKQINVDPGDSYEDTIDVTNVTDTPVDVSVSVKDFGAKGETGQPTFYDKLNQFSLVDWVKIDQSFNLTGKEKKKITYQISIPKNAEPGGHYAAILFSPSASEEALSTNAIGSVIQVGILLMVDVSGNVITSAQLEQFAVDKQLYSYEPVNFIVRIKNFGNVDFKPVGNVTIYNAWGNPVKTLTVNENEGSVLPNSIRRFDPEWEYGRGFGWYTGKLNLAYGGASDLSGEVLFFIIPWKETLIVVVALILIIWLFSSYKLQKK